MFDPGVDCLLRLDTILSLKVTLRTTGRLIARAREIWKGALKPSTSGKERLQDLKSIWAFCSWRAAFDKRRLTFSSSAIHAPTRSLTTPGDLSRRVLGK